MFVRTRISADLLPSSLEGASAITKRTRLSKVAPVVALAGAFSALAASNAFAENCTFPATGNNLPSVGASASAVSSMVGSLVTAANTAFLLQSTAFIGAAPNPQPNQQGGGVWVRGVDGNVNIKSSSTAAVVGTGGAVAGGAAAVAIACSQQVNVNFGGFQLGQDLAKLNYDGWNIHSGVTAGDLGTKGILVGGFPQIASIAGPQGGGQFVGQGHIPFIGGYFAATNGGFAVDALFREQFFQSNIDAPISNIFNQSIDARGWSFAASMSYQYAIPETNWFVEPSAGIVISRTKVDPFNFQTAGFGTVNSFTGTLQVNDIKSDIGRLGLRFGETIESGGVVWQPFGAVSVWHEFGSDITSNYSTVPGFFTQAQGAVPAAAATVTGSGSTTNFGTYGQYSVGLAAIIEGTGWSEFIRADYRDGKDLTGWSGSGGLRYTFAPDPSHPAMPLKAKAPPMVRQVNWTGFYLGGFGGSTQGTADWGYAVGSVSPHVSGYLFGGDVGYNYQMDRYVLGAEFDIGATHTYGGMGCSNSGIIGAVPGGAGPVAPGAPMFAMTCNAWANWLATATARLGYTWDRALFYVKAGGAWTNEHVEATCNYGVFNGPPNQTPCNNPAGLASNGLRANKGMGGWVLGWGTEYALTDHWSAKGEADYISFGSRNVTAADVTVNPDTGAANPPSTLKIGMHVWEEKIGVNYKF